MRVFQFEDINLHCLPQFWRRTRTTLQLNNHVLHPDKATATLKQQSQTRLRNVTSSNMEAMNQLSNTLTFSWRNMIFEQETQQKMRERRTTNDRLPTKT